MKLQEDMITIRGDRAKSIGKRRKPERMPGTNRDDAVKMLEKYDESAGKCDNNQRKIVQKPAENEGGGWALKRVTGRVSMRSSSEDENVVGSTKNICLYNYIYIYLFIFIFVAIYRPAPHSLPRSGK